MRPITFLAYKWRAHPKYRYSFNASHVNVLARMIRRNFAHPHRFVCYTDEPGGVDPDVVDVREIWTDHAELANYPRVSPAGFRRLKMFSRDAEEWLGERVVMMDLDTVITGDLTPIVDRPEPFVANKGAIPTMAYNSGLIMFTTGARPQLWEEFDPVESLAFIRSHDLPHTDDGWMCAKLGPDEAKFGPDNGVYSFRNDLLKKRDTLPENAAIVTFEGWDNPDGPVAQQFEWVRRNYR
ncbi:MAG: hypothetical protein ACREEB_05775 [Caulobacteraceae bacterium]